ncbi:hypothetical protein BGZ46_009118 [Entomortierella lignicola]|nr:hypothetical protein BGZ46_009118 [Entomortierella lignicola]
MALGNPLNAWRGEIAIPLLTDENFELISSYPGTVLDVVIRSSGFEAGTPQYSDEPVRSVKPDSINREPQSTPDSYCSASNLCNYAQPINETEGKGTSSDYVKTME